MSILIAIIGLGFLVMIHEAGHFFTARAVGMKPKRFYVGFPPALLKTTRKGIEYGIGAIPLGGYVKIPGMHRPAPSDLDVQLGPALNEDPSLFPKMARVKRDSAAGKAARRAVDELRDGLSDDAYWRQRTWKRIAVIFAGPGVNILLAVALVAAAYMIGLPGDP